MKLLRAIAASAAAWLLLAALITIVTACKSTPKPDWNQRIGTYTFDDAVRDMGPPASSARLEDGSTVAEWFLKYGSTMSFGLGTGAYGPVGGMDVGQTVTLPPKAYFLRLVFGPDGKLRSWGKIKR